MSVTVRRMNAEEKAFWDAMMLRSCSFSHGAPFLTSQLFALDPFVLDAPEDAANIPVFAVDEQARVYMHMTRIMKAGIEFASTGLIHEGNHVFREHFRRFKKIPERYDQDLVNIAEDMEINDDLSSVRKDASGKIVDYIAPSSAKSETFRSIMKAHYPQINFSPVFPLSYDLKDNQSAEEYLHLLQEKRNEQKEQQKEQSDSGDDSGEGEDGDDSEGQGSGSGGQDQKDQGDKGGRRSGSKDEQGDKHGSGVCGGGSGTGDQPFEWELGAKSSDPESPSHSGKTPEELEIVRSQVANDIADYVKSHGIGSVPAGLHRMAIDILADPQVSWKQVIRGMVMRVLRVQRAGHTEIDRSKRDRRYANVTKIIYPGKKEYVPSIGVGLDSSASMSKADMTTGVTEIGSILRSCGVRSSGVQMFTVDAHAYDVQTIRDVREIKIKGGGGTDMMKCFDAFDTMDIDVGIIMTDGDCYWDKTRPKSKRYTVIVLVISDNPQKANPSLFPPGVVPIHVKPSAL